MNISAEQPFTCNGDVSIWYEWNISSGTKNPSKQTNHVRYVCMSVICVFFKKLNYLYNTNSVRLRFYHLMFLWISKKNRLVRAARKSSEFHNLSFTSVAAVTWSEYCRFGVKYKQSIYLLFNDDARLIKNVSKHFSSRGNQGQNSSWIPFACRTCKLNEQLNCYMYNPTDETTESETTYGLGFFGGCCRTVALLS